MLLILLTIFVALPVSLFFGLRWVARRWIPRHSGHPYAARITPVGLTLYGLTVLAFIYIFGAYQLHPEAGFGLFLRTHGGIPAALLSLSIIVGVIEVALRRCGHPATRMKVARDV